MLELDSWADSIFVSPSTGNINQYVVPSVDMYLQ